MLIHYQRLESHLRFILLNYLKSLLKYIEENFSHVRIIQSQSWLVHVSEKRIRGHLGENYSQHLQKIKLVCLVYCGL